MDNQLFRKKSLEHISSPESLHDYMRVTSPRLWMILAAIVLLLAGFIVFASTARLESTMKVKAQVSGNKASVVLPISDMEKVKNGMKVRIGEEEGTIGNISTLDNQMYAVINLSDEKAVMTDGEYDAEIVTESTTPISFLWN